MAKKKKSPGSTATSTPPESPPLDPSVLVEVLAAEYQLIDPSLISALLSDYDPAFLSSNLGTIRDQLGILEAALVPDENGRAADDSVDLGVAALRLTHNESSEPSERTGSGGSGQASADAKSTSTDPTEGSTLDGSTDSEEGELELLHSLFPARSPRELSTALDEFGVSGAIDHLLSLELLHDVERKGYWPGESPPHVAEREAGQAIAMSRSSSGHSIVSNPPALLVDALHAQLATASSSKESLSLGTGSIQSAAGLSKTKQKTKKKKQTVALVDTLQRGSRPASGATTPSKAHADMRGDNAWYTLTSLSVYLAELTSAPAAHFLSYLHSPSFHSAHAAVQAALADLPPADLEGDSDDHAVRVIHDLYGESLAGDFGDDLAVCVHAVGSDVGTVLDLMELLAEVSYWPTDDDFAPSASSPVVASPRAVASPMLPPLPMSPAALHEPSLSHQEPASQPHEPRHYDAAPAVPSTGRFVNPNRLHRPVLPPSRTVAPRIVPGAQPAANAAALYDAIDHSDSATLHASKPRHNGVHHHPLNWRKVQHERVKRAPHLHAYAGNIPAYARGVLPHDPTPGALSAASRYADGDMSAQECWERAQVERARREDAARSAGRYYRGAALAGGKAANGAVAGHYALQAREAATAAREWELRAARAVVHGQLARTGHTVDLHYMTVDEAKALALEVADEWYERQKRAFYGGADARANKRNVGFAPPVPLTVIVGLGRHSAGHKGVLGPAVEAALDAAGWRVSRPAGQGYLLVRGAK